MGPSEGFAEAFGLIIRLDPALTHIVALSLRVTLTATLLACLIALPLGAALAIGRFAGRDALIVVLNALMGLPPVVVGLAVYLALSASGPFGVLGLLYTPAAMILAQMLLVTPIVAALSRQTIADLDREYAQMLAAQGAGRWARIVTLLWDARMSLLTAALAGLGRALAEVGAVMLVGGNIDHLTRVMTTAITLETSRGNIGLALGLGIILLTMTLVINGAAYGIGQRFGGAAHG